MSGISSGPGCYICTPRTWRKLCEDPRFMVRPPTESAPSVPFARLEGIPVYVIEVAPEGVLTPLPEDITRVTPLVFTDRAVVD